MKGRKVGEVNEVQVTLEEIHTIIIMTLSKDPLYTRSDIAKSIGRSKYTVLKYQKYYGLL